MLTSSWEVAGQGASLRPRLVALQVENLDASVRWYTTHLALAILLQVRVARQHEGHAFHTRCFRKARMSATSGSQSECAI